MTEPENTGLERADYATRFKPGNPGKPKGAKHALTENFIKALHDNFVAKGAETIEVVRVEKPDQYLKVIASLVTKDVNLTVNNVDDLSDAELAERVRQLAETLAPFLLAGNGDAGESVVSTESKAIAPIVH